jgi:hypothetical protein
MSLTQSYGVTFIHNCCAHQFPTGILASGMGDGLTAHGSVRRRHHPGAMAFQRRRGLLVLDWLACICLSLVVHLLALDAD